MAEDEDKFKESIWAIYPEWRGLFYVILLVCGIVVSALTPCKKWSESWIEIFNDIGRGIISSVVVVWFGFQAWGVIMGAYQYFQELKERKIQKIRQEERERIQKRLANSLREQGVSEKVIQNTVQTVCSSPNER